MAVELLVNMLDIPRILSDQHRREIFNRTHDGSRLPLKRRLAPSEKAHLVGQDLNKNPIPHLRVDHDRLDIGNFHRSLYLPTTPGGPPSHMAMKKWKPQISPLRYAPVEMTILLVQTNLSSRPERSVVERSAVSISGSLTPHPSRTAPLGQ